MDKAFESVVRAACEKAVAMRPDIERELDRVLALAPKEKEWKHPVLHAGEHTAETKLRDLSIKHRIPSITVPMFTVAEDGIIQTGSTQMDGSLMSLGFFKVEEGMDLMGITYPRYTEDMAMIQILDEDNPDAHQYVNDAFILTNDEGLKDVFRLHSGKLYDCNGKELSAEKSAWAAQHLYRSYGLASGVPISTPGNRKKREMAVPADREDIELVRATMTSSMSLFPVLNEKGKISKWAARIAQSQCPQSVGGRLYCTVIYTGKNVAGDGQSELCDETAVRFLNSLSNGKFTCKPRHLRGTAIQGRPVGVKGLFSTEAKEMVLTKIKRTIKRTGKEPVILVRSAITEDDLFNYGLAFEKEGPWANRIIVVVESQEMAANWERFVDIFVDFNAVKAWVDLGLPAWFPILDVSHEVKDCEDGGRLSSQVLSKMGFAHPLNTKKLALLAAQKAVLQKVDAWNETANETIGLSAALDARSVLERIAPDSIKYLRTIFDGRIKQQTMAFTSALGLNRGKIFLMAHGEYRKAFVDPSMNMCGFKVLKVRKNRAEVLMAGVKPGTEFFMVRFPTPGTHEYIRVIVVSPEKYEARLSQEGATDDERRMIMDYVLSLSKGVIVLQDSEVLLGALGGADFDGDGYILYEVAATSKEFKELSLEEIVNIDDIDKLNELLMQGFRFFYDTISPKAVIVPEF